MKVRTRNAPSPTGYAHIGTIYQSLFDKAFAHKNKGNFILRIEDTDQKRYVEGAEDHIYKAMDWVGLTPDESPVHGGAYGPYRQSERLHIYQDYANELVKNGHAYYCFCSPERLEQVRQDMQKRGVPPMYDKHCRNIPPAEAEKRIAAKETYVVRMKVPDSTTIEVTDLIRGKILFESSTIDDQVLLKSDGFPTYHLAVIVDDHLMEISHVVRGPEWLTSFPKHKLLYDFFGWEAPVFVHTPMITNMDNSKLSKRQGHTNVDWYRRKGYLSEAVLNFISLLGWSHPQEKEIFSYDEFLEAFDLKDLSPVSPKFDLKKLEWMTGQYMQALEDSVFVTRLTDWLKYCYGNEYVGVVPFDTAWTKNDYANLLALIESLPTEKQLIFAQICKSRIKVFEDLLPLVSFFVTDTPISSDSLTKYKDAQAVADHLGYVEKLVRASDWVLENLKEIEKDLVNRAGELDWKTLEVFYPIRIAVCLSPVSPPLFESMFILGKEKTLERLDHAINLLC